jgi:general secretion pathway protein J
MKSNGFTLVEMLIALAIFGMLTAGGVVLLGVTVRTQEVSERLLDELGTIRRTGALLNADLGQAAPRLRRDRDGRPVPAFQGADGGEAMLMSFVRRGGDEESDLPHSALQRVAYRLAGGRLERLAFSHVDGEARAIVMPLLEGVRRARLRYRDPDGSWRARWDPTDPTRMPRAVELITESEAHGEIRQLFLVAGDGR